MTLIGKDHSVLVRALNGVKAAIVPRVPLASDSRRTLVLGHRGAERLAPENTVAACRAAIDAGAQGVEVDVSVTADGRVVLWHDRDPGSVIAKARCRGAESTAFVPYMLPDCTPLPIAELTLQEVMARHGYAEWTLAGTPERIARVETFEAFVEWLAHEPRARVAMIDVKIATNELHNVRHLLRALERALAEHPSLSERCLHLLCAERELYVELSRKLRRRGFEPWQLTADCELPGVLSAARELGARHVALGVTLRRMWSAVRNEAVDAVRARRRGELSSVTMWTIDDADQLQECRKIGVDYVIVGDDLLAQQDQSAVTTT